MTMLTLTRPEAPTPGAVRAVLRAREKLVDFNRYLWADYLSPPHICTLCEVLDAITRDEVQWVMVRMPPRHGKSLTVSRYFPVYYLCKHPDRHIIQASYGAELAHSFGREARNVMLNEYRGELFPDVHIRTDSAAAHRWNTNHGGGLLATGIPGPITGRGAHLLNIDDPIRGREDAESEIKREAVWQWYQADARTRLEPRGAVCLTYTPWHEDDLGGRILNSSEQGRWHVVDFPAVGDDGMPLWPERFPLEALDEIKRDVGPRDWEALFMLRPSPPEGHLFKWWNTYPVDVQDPTAILVPIDTAWTSSATSDYTAVAAWGVRGKNVDLIDAQRWQLEPPQAQEMILKFFAALLYRYPNRRVIPLVREAVAIDRVMATHLQHRRMPIVPVKLPAIGGAHVKEALASMIVDYFQAGIARIPEHTSWLADWQQEHKSFPTGAHDDWVETTILAFHYYRQAIVDTPQQRVRQQGIRRA